MKSFFLLPLFLLSLLFFSACKQTVDYFDYVAECRSNLFLAKTEDFSLKIYAVRKESPYAADGIPRKAEPRFEAYLVAPQGNESVTLSFHVEEKEYGGEMSYDNVKGEYFYACALDVSSLSKIDCEIVYGEQTLTLVASSVLTELTLTPKAALEKLCAEHKTLFAEMTDEYGFAGEIYLRLLYEDAPYYYIGVIDRTGKIDAFLMNAETGKILARREG